MFGRDDGLLALRGEVAAAMRALLAEQPIALDPQHIDEAAEYLVWNCPPSVPNSPSANMPGNCRKDSSCACKARVYGTTTGRPWSVSASGPPPSGNWPATGCADYVATPSSSRWRPTWTRRWRSLLDEEMPRRITEVDLRFQVDGLMGEHPRIFERGLALAVDDFFGRLRRHRQQFLPGLRRYQALRQEIVEHEREALRLAEFKPRPLSSFVRNKLINDVYLGVIGDNLAKQMGTVGENKRTDLMGLLMLISPPGYGKTTLMEYVAHRLGLIFMKINGPALGHEVRSLDPAGAGRDFAAGTGEAQPGAGDGQQRDALCRRHPAHPSGVPAEVHLPLRRHAPGGRGVEGPDQDLRHAWAEVLRGDGGQPYTESGEVFRIPDMLANRADIYNLGDTLSGMQEAFSSATSRTP